MILRNEKYSEITCQNINLHSSADYFNKGHDITASAYFTGQMPGTYVWCSVKLERIKRMPYMHTHKSDSTDKHAQQPEDRIDFTVKLKSYSLQLKLPAKWEWHDWQCTVYLFTSLERSVKTQVWTLYQNTQVNLVLQSIFARARKTLPTHAQQLQDHICSRLSNWSYRLSLCLALRFWDLA